MPYTVRWYYNVSIQTSASAQAVHKALCKLLAQRERESTGLHIYAYLSVPLTVAGRREAHLSGSTENEN